MQQNKVIIFSAPSGAGKSTIVNHLLKIFPMLEFSISATSRAPRGAEQTGVDYYFLSQEEFAEGVTKGEFLEWEEVYHGTSYGTLNSELSRIWNKGNIVVFDVDVVGGLNIKQLLGHKALSLFIMPPSVDELRRRLIGRATDSSEAIDKRVAKAEKEISYSDKFDKVVINDSLKKAIIDVENIVRDFIK